MVLPAQRTPRLSSLGLAIVFALFGCSDRGAKNKHKAAQPQAQPIDAAVSYDPSTFCEEVFAASAVRGIVGYEILVSKSLAGAEAAKLASMQCGYVAVDDPARIVTLRVDCIRPRSVQEQRKILSAMAREGDDYKEVEIGGGGAKLHHHRFASRFLAYSHQLLPCSITLEGENMLEDRLDGLAALVQKRLNSSNRPRPGRAPASDEPSP